MEAQEFNLDNLRVVLERTPSVLTAWLNGLSEEFIRAREGEGTRSPYDGAIASKMDSSLFGSSGANRPNDRQNAKLKCRSLDRLFVRSV